MKAAVRVHSLTLNGYGPKTLAAMEAHGKRLDATSQSRRIRDVEPLVHNTLDLRDAYDKHVEGCRMNAGLKRPVLHAIVQYPAELGKKESRRKKMLEEAVKFINKTHGGDAVFAARYDLDEQGVSTVDVFYTPKYQKPTKRKDKEPETWASTTKHGKELARKHEEEIKRRHGGKFASRPRQVGIALQAEFYEYLTKTARLPLEPRTEKDSGKPDRVDPETYKMRKDARRELEEAKAAREAAAQENAEATRNREATAQERAEATRDRVAAAEELRHLQEERASQAAMAELAAKTAANAAVQAVVGVLTGASKRQENGRWAVEDPEALRPIWLAVRPILERVSEWWERFRPRVEALPEPEQQALLRELPDDDDESPGLAM